MLTRLSGTSLRLRVGLAVAMIVGAVGYSIADGWNVISVIATVGLAVLAARFTPDIGKSIDPRA